eukprot:7391790-Prymnesium_polylepis.1
MRICGVGSDAVQAALLVQPFTILCRGASDGNQEVSAGSVPQWARRLRLAGWRWRTDRLGVALVLRAHLFQRDNLSAALDLSDIVTLTFDTHHDGVLEQRLQRLYLVAVRCHTAPSQHVHHAPLWQTSIVEALAVVVSGLLVHTNLPEPNSRAMSMGRRSCGCAHLARSSQAHYDSAAYRVLKSRRERERLDLLAAVELRHNLVRIHPSFAQHRCHDDPECWQQRLHRLVQLVGALAHSLNERRRESLLVASDEAKPAGDRFENPLITTRPSTAAVQRLLHRARQILSRCL